MALKVLVIAYYWPPAGGPGVQRWLKFVKYLSEFGIKPYVFVPENPSYPIVDESLIGEIPRGVTIIKRPIREPYGFASALSRKQTKTISSGILPKEGKQSILQKVMLYVRGNYFIPDARVGWVKPSVNYLKTYLEQNEIEHIITTGPPHSLHLIGRALKKYNSELKWFADFRDPWTTIGYHDKLRMTAKTKARHKHLEKEILCGADQIIVTSPSTKEEFSNITTKPITVITNGFDTKIADTTVKSSNDNSFVLGHFGSLLSDRNPKILWEVLSEIKQEDPVFAKALKLVFAGKVSQEVLDSIKKYELNYNLDFLGYVSHNELNKFRFESDALLLIEIDSPITKSIIPGKLFEYLASRKPIVALGPESSDVETIINKTNSGVYFTYQQKVNLKNYLISLYNKQQTVIDSKKVVIKQYHRRALTSQLAALLKDNI